MPPLIPIIIGAALAASGVGGIILGGLTALTIGITGLGASLILGGLSRLLLPKPPSLAAFIQEARGRTITARQPVTPWRVILGKIRVGGVITFLHVTGTNKEFLHMVITISGHEVEEIGDMYFDGVLVPIDGSGNATGKFLNHVHVEKNLGTDTQAAFPGLLADAPTKWTANHRQLGRAGVYVRLKFNPDKFPGNIPNITFDVKGKKVFDPRTSTTVFSNNAALCFSDYLLDTDYGVGVPQSKIDNNAWIAAANLCEEQVALAAGGFEDRYTCNGSFLVSERPVDIMLALLTAMGGTAVYSGGFWFIYGAAFRTPTLSFDEGDLRGPLRVQSRTGRSQLFNAVKGLYVSAANNWQPSDFPPVTNATFESEDGGKRIYRDIELPYTISAATAQRLAKIELERARRQKTVEVRFGPTAFQAQPPDVIQLSVARFGWSSKTFEVLDERLMLEQDEDGTPRPEIMLTLRETDVNVYGFSAEDAPPTAPGDPDLPDTTVAAPPTALVLSSFSITRTDGIRVTFLKAAWTAPADEFVTAGGMIEIEYKKNSSGIWLPTSPVPGNETEQLIPFVDDDVAYDVRIRSVNVALAKSVFVEQLNFTVTGATSTVSVNASDGKTAFDQTVEYRKSGAPTNDPSPSSLGTELKTDSSMEVSLSWAAYVQGARKATGLLVYFKKGTSPLSAPTDGDPAFKMPIAATSVLIQGLNPDDNYRFGIAAYRVEETGMVRGLIKSPTSAPDWADISLGPGFAGAQFFLRGKFVPDQLNGGGNTGEIDFDPITTGADYVILHPDGSVFNVTNAQRSRMSQGCLDTDTGRRYIIFSQDLVNSQRGLAAFQDSHILVVRWNEGSLQYDNNSTFVAFTGRDTDIVIFEVDRSGLGWAGKPTRYIGSALGAHIQVRERVEVGLDDAGNLIFKNVENSVGVTVSPTTISSTFATIPEMTKTFTSKGKQVLLIFDCIFNLTAPQPTGLEVRFVRDSTVIGKTVSITVTSVVSRDPTTFVRVDTGASAGSHTWKVEWRRSFGSGTHVASVVQREIQVVELA